MCDIALQLYAVRDHYLLDMPGTLKALSKMGYKKVEGFWMYPCRAAEFDKMLKDNGLSICGWHIGLDQLTDDRLMPTLEYHDRIGNNILGINAGLDMLDTPEKIAALRDQLESAREKLEKHGFVLQYHNHWWEFSGTDIYDTLMDNSTVYAQFDVGNALKGGANATDYYKKYSGRHIAAHLKPYSFTTGFDCTIGDQNDSVPWAEVLNGLKQQNTKHLIIEFESVSNQLELAKKNIDGLKKFIV